MATSTLTSAQKSAMDYISDYMGNQTKADQIGDIMQQVESTLVAGLNAVPTSAGGSTVVSEATSYNTTQSSVTSSYSTVTTASSVAASSTATEDSSAASVTTSGILDSVESNSSNVTAGSSVTSSYSTVRTTQSVTTSSTAVTISSHMSLTHAAGSVMGSFLQAGDEADSAGSKTFASFAIEGEVWDQIGSAISSASA